MRRLAAAFTVYLEKEKNRKIKLVCMLLENVNNVMQSSGRMRVKQP